MTRRSLFAPHLHAPLAAGVSLRIAILNDTIPEGTRLFYKDISPEFSFCFPLNKFKRVDFFCFELLFYIDNEKTLCNLKLYTILPSQAHNIISLKSRNN